jgi:hypothetical protein
MEDGSRRLATRLLSLVAAPHGIIPTACRRMTLPLH